MEEKEKEYKKIIDELIEDIKNIDKKSLPDWEKSDEIMRLLREECLFLHEVYIDGYANFSKKATLDFKNAFLKFDLSNVEVLPTKFYPIFANSFGPFNPKEYFEQDYKDKKDKKIKILWLLKESYITKESWVKNGDRGGHDQAKEYNKWETIKGTNDTKKRVVELTRLILSIIDEGNEEFWKKTYNEDQEDKIYQKVMDHICILEVQHFPGLAFSGTSTDDKRKKGYFLKWAELNKLLIEELIQFYTPQIIIGGHTLKYFFPSEYGTYKHYKDNIYKAINNKEDLKVFGNQLINHCDDKNNNWIFINENGQILIDADHPCRYDNYTNDHATADGNEILKLINTFSNQLSI